MKTMVSLVLAATLMLGAAPRERNAEVLSMEAIQCKTQVIMRVTLQLDNPPEIHLIYQLPDETVFAVLILDQDGEFKEASVLRGSKWVKYKSVAELESSEGSPCETAEQILESRQSI